MKHTIHLRIFTETVRAALIGLFCYTAINKWLSYDDFLYQLRQSPFLTGGYRFLSFFLPLTELFISGMLSFNKTIRMGFLLSAGILIVFTGYIIIMLRLAPHVPCSCGGFVSSLSWQQHIVLNSSLAVLAILAYRWQGRNEAPEHTTNVRKSLLQ